MMRAKHYLGVTAILFLLFFAVSPIYAVTISVTTATDGIGVSGCSLREAIQSANNDDAGTTGCTAGSGDDTLELTVNNGYALTDGSDLDITSNITIQEATGVTAWIEAAPTAGIATWRVFNLSGSASLTLNDLLVRH